MKKRLNPTTQAYLLRGTFWLLVLLGGTFMLTLFRPEAKATVANRTLTFAERVAYQRAIEDVYWRHRIWPKDRPDPKPSLDAVMSHEQLEKKVTDYLRNSETLEDYWQRPITSNQLQAEMDRIATHTKQPGALREIFDALGNDPFVIAECLARQLLAERLITELNNEGRGKLARIAWQKQTLQSGVATAEAQVPVTMAAASANYMLPVIASASVACTDDTWTPTSIPAPVQTVQYDQYNNLGTFATLSATFTDLPPDDSDLADDFVVPAGLALTVQSIDADGLYFDGSGPANSFNVFFYTDSGGFPGSQIYSATDQPWTQSGTTFTVHLPGYGAAIGAGTYWVEIQANMTFSSHGEWGWTNRAVQSNNGAAWKNASGVFGMCQNWSRRGATCNIDPSEPDQVFRLNGVVAAGSGRHYHTAVWTGTQMIVWGGEDLGNDPLNTGGTYNPSSDSWTATSVTGMPAARYWHTVVWTGSEMIIWGGYDGNGYFNTGGRYNPITDSWTATSTTNAPAARRIQTAVWTGSEMIIWGGQGDNGYVVNTGGRYNPSTDSWTATSTINAPSGRYLHTAVWTGSQMIVWGGGGDSAILNNGGIYNPGTNSWTATSTANAPDPRFSHTAVWTGSEMIVWSGQNDSGGLNTGGRYNPSTNSWTATSLTNAPIPRIYPTAVWTGSQMIVWGGYGANNFLNTGGRYNPSTDSWTATSTTNAPTAREEHTAVWTGSEMIIWGGNDGNDTNTGGRYCVQSGPPPSPTPTPTPTPCAGRCSPTPRPNPTLAGRPTPPPRLTPPPTPTGSPRPTPPPRP